MDKNWRENEKICLNKESQRVLLIQAALLRVDSAVGENKLRMLAIMELKLCVKEELFVTLNNNLTNITKKVKFSLCSLKKFPTILLKDENKRKFAVYFMWNEVKQFN